MLYIVGLGPGSVDHLPVPSLSLLTGGLPVYLRTARHPTLQSVRLADFQTRSDVVTFDSEYEVNASFEDTYAAIVERLLRACETHNDLVYAVPGHPLVGESTVALLLAELKALRIPFRVVGAPSFVDACLEAVGEAVTGDLHIVDALTLVVARPSDTAAPHEVLLSGGPLLLYQVYERDIASHTKLALMQAGYPDDFPVTLIRGAGIAGVEQINSVALYELDRGVCDHLTSVYVPALPASELRTGFSDLRRVMARLRAPDGCPWDKEQTHQTLRRYVLEEAYEVAEAIDQNEPDALCEELGDLLLQVVFHAELAREEGLFDADDVCHAIVSKLIRRHPHVFGNVEATTPDQVLTNWNAIKAQEKQSKGDKEAGIPSVLDGIPASLPALSAALETSKRAVKAGFEWPDTGGVLDKVEEEFRELRTEIEAGAKADKTKTASELGDLLFTLVNVARKLGIDPEQALRDQNARFGKRFRFMEARAHEAGTNLSDLTLEQMEVFWGQAKQKEREPKPAPQRI